MFSQYRKRLEKIGSNSSEAKINIIRNATTYTFDSSISFTKIKLSSIENDYIDARVWEGEGNSYSLQLKPGVEANIGDYVFIDDSPIPWLICEGKQHGVFITYTINKCDYLLKWMRGNKIISRWCYFQGTSGGTISSEASNLIKLVNFNLNIVLPFDSEVGKIFEGQRFIIGIPEEEIYEAYSVENKNITKCEFENRTGVVILNLAKKTINTQMDNLELLIADYYREPREEAVTPPEFVYKNKPTIMMGVSSYKEFKFDCDDIDGVILTLNLGDDCDKYIDYIIEQNVCKIRCSTYASALIGASISLVAVYNGDEYKLSIKVVNGI